MGDKHFDVGILQPGYLPWLGYFDLVALSDVFVFYDDVQFDRGGWRNRNRLLNGTKPVWITVPVLKKGQAFKRVNEIEIGAGNWPKKHLQMIKTIYGRAPYFRWCFPALEEYLRKQTWRRLLDLCLEGHRVFTELLALRTKTVLASELGSVGIGRTERLVALCKILGATRYIAADASAAYMKDELWRAAGVELVYQRYPHPAYPQFGGEFVSHLSIVDALMFVGPETRGLVGLSHSKERTPSPAACGKVDGA